MQIKFGGHITVLGESNAEGVKTPDYIWNDKFWELKTPQKPLSDSLIRKSLKQIKDNSGGIVFDLRNIEESLDSILEKLDYRVGRSKVSDVDVILIMKSGKLNVFRYKKK